MDLNNPFGKPDKKVLSKLKEYMISGGTIAEYCEKSGGKLTVEKISNWINQDPEFSQWLVSFEMVLGRSFQKPSNYLEYYYMRGKLR